MKTAQKAAQAAKATAKATAHAIKAAVKATIAAIKAIIAGTKALIAAIMAGGWIAVAVILIICLIGLLVGSVFGIFFSGEDSGNGMTMQTVVREINADYDSRLDEIINGTSHDVLEMSGSRAVWKEVLAVYSVKTTTDPDNPQEVATMGDNKKQLLKDIFWEMNEISFRTESKTETQITESDDGHGNIVETETTVTQSLPLYHREPQDSRKNGGQIRLQRGTAAAAIGITCRGKQFPLVCGALRHHHRGRRNRHRGSVAGGQRRRRAVLVMVRF